MSPATLPFPVCRLCAASLLLTVTLAGCANPRGGHVIAVPNRQVAGLSADDTVRVMRRAGLADRQILELGTELRNALASSGAANVRVGNKVEAIFAVDGDCLHASSRTRGSFIYDLKKRTFR